MNSISNATIKQYIKYKIPAYSAWLCLVFTSMRIYAGEAMLIESISFFAALLLLAGEMVYVFFVILGKSAEGHKTHVREIIRERERVIEPEYDEGADLETWQDYETEHGIESVRQITGDMTDEQLKAHFQARPPSTPEQAERLAAKYNQKGFKKTWGALMNIQRKLIKAENQKLKQKAGKQGEMLPVIDRSPTYQFKHQ